MKDNSILNKVRELLGMEVKLAERRLEDGQTRIEAEEFAAGFQVAIVTEDEQKIPMPVGEYKLDGDEGEMLVIEEEGIIAEIKKEEVEEVVEEEVETKEEEVEAATEETKPVKKTVESIVKETFFSEIEALKKENEELKAEVEHLSKINNKEEFSKDETTEEVTSEEVVEETVELSNEEPAAKPITHNPENEEKIELHQFSKNRAKSTMDRVMEKLSKK
tara:strand:- start:314 stop:970 length:657 start_codon:yes stop_codon:yes gene_type:complete